MKKLLICTLLLSQQVLSCDFKTGIVRKETHVEYSMDCHKFVGKLIKDDEDRKEEVSKLKEVIKLKDLAMDFSVREADLWKKEANNQYDIMQKHSKYRPYEKWIWLSGGVAITVLSVWAAGQLK